MSQIGHRWLIWDFAMTSSLRGEVIVWDIRVDASVVTAHVKIFLLRNEYIGLHYRTRAGSKWKLRIGIFERAAVESRWIQILREPS